MANPSRRRSNLPIVLAVISIVIGVAAIGVYVGQRMDGPTAAPTTSSPAAPSPTADPYAVYLKLAPKDAPKLTRDEAQARAMLGCGQSWAPGTVDAALAKAYAGLCKGNG